MRLLTRLTSDLAPVGIALVALLARAIYLAEIAAGDAVRLYLGDARSYHQWAQALAGGDWLGQGVFYQAPLYPYLLGALYAVLGQEPMIVRAAQALLGAAACGLLALAGRDLLGRRAGIAAALLLALYPPALFFDGILQKTSLTGFLVAGLLAALGRHRVRAGWGAPLAAGILLGLLALTRENTLALAPVVAVWLACAPRERPRRARLTALAMAAAGLLLALAPVATRNLAVGGELHLTTSQLGPNLYIGNHAGADGTYQPLRPGRGDPLYERQDATWLAEQAAGRELTPGEVSGYWARRAAAFAAEQPLAWSRLMLRKLHLAYGAVEIGDTEDLYTYAESSRLLAMLAPWLHMGLLVPLAAAGAVLAWRRRPGTGLLLALLAVYSLAVAVFFIFARYRFPLVAPLALLAGVALVEIADRLRHRLGRGAPPRPIGRRRALAAVAAASAGAILANWPLQDPDGFRVSTHANIANELITAGRHGPALRHLEISLALAPDYPNAHHLMGIALSDLGRRDEAERHYRQAIAGDPATALPYYCLGVLLAESGRGLEAEELLRGAIERDPTHANSFGALGVTLAQQGRTEEALDLLQRGLDLDPASPEIAYNYALTLRRAGRGGEARTIFERLLALRPDHTAARHNLVTLLLEAGDARRARAELEALVRAEPGEIGAAVRLGWLLACHVDPAVRDGRRALELARELIADGQAGDPRLLDLLAAALAETGDTARAADVGRAAVALALEGQAADLATEISARVALYERGEPCRGTVW